MPAACILANWPRLRSSTNTKPALVSPAGLTYTSAPLAFSRLSHGMASKVSAFDQVRVSIRPAWSRLPSTHRPRLRQWEKGGYAASTPERNATGYMPMLGPLSLSRLLLRCWASLACSCWCLTTSGWVNTALTVRAT